MRVELIQATPEPIKTISDIASICYDSEPENPLKLVKQLYSNGHHSVFEHIYFTFKIEGISRACSHQLVRHRHCSFTQRSQRYCMEDDFEYVVPPVINEFANYYFTKAMTEASEEYSAIIDKGAKPEDARMVLPNACATELYLSCNLRELIHMANERLCFRAQWEIRGLLQKMYSLVDKDLQFMLVPKCKSGYLICNNPCKEV